MTFLKPEAVCTQLFWDGGCDKQNKDLNDWFAFASRAPHLRGHVLLANKNCKNDLNKIPVGFESAFNRVACGLLKWAKEHKGKDIHLVFYRMNIEQDQFRVHIVPVSKCEMEISSICLQERIKEDEKGGMVYFLGKKEDAAERIELEFKKLKKKRDKKSIQSLLKAYGITDFANELRTIFSFKVVSKPYPSANIK
jgi:hypothetical protein